MNTLLRHLTIEKFFFFYNFLLAARATKFTLHLDPRTNLIGFVLLVVPMLYLYKKYRVSIWNKRFIFMAGILGIWSLYHIINDESVKYLQYVMIFIRIFAMYLLIILFKKKLIIYSEKCIEFLTFMSLIMWGVMHLVGVKTIEQFGFIEPASVTSGASFLIFNTPNIEYYSDDLGIFGLMRNCGFCWEPGLFSSFIVIGMVFNLMVHKNNLPNIGLYILILGLFTTFSTTGYVAFFLLLFLRYLYGSVSVSSAVLGIVILIPITFAIIDLPFMQDKIIKLMDEEEFTMNKTKSLSYINEEERLSTAQRFEGLALDMIDIKERPILGYAQRENSIVYNTISEYLLTSNGLTKLAAQYGILLALFYFVFLAKSSKLLGQSFSLRMDYMYLMVFLIVSVSYGFYQLALFNAITFYSFFHQQIRNG